MGFLDSLFRYPSFNIWILALFFTIHCLHLVDTQETPVIIQSPPPPPPPPPPPSPPPPSPPPPPLPVKATTKTARVAPQPSPVTDVTKPLLPPSQKNPPRRLPQPPPPQLPPPSQPPEKSKRDGLNKGEMVGVVFVGLIAMLQVFVAVFLVFKRKQLLKSKTLIN